MQRCKQGLEVGGSTAAAGKGDVNMLLFDPADAWLSLLKMPKFNGCVKKTNDCC
jgi:hypothetical protein